MVSDRGDAGGGWMLTSSSANAFVFKVAFDFSRANLMEQAVPPAERSQLGREPGRLSPEGVTCDDTCMTTASGNRCKGGKKIGRKGKKAKISKRNVISGVITWQPPSRLRPRRHGGGHLK